VVVARRGISCSKGTFDDDAWEEEEEEEEEEKHFTFF
jgi:hypothetical protein